MTLHTFFWLLVAVGTLLAGITAMLFGLLDMKAEGELSGRRAWRSLFIVGSLLAATLFAAAACVRLALEAA